MSFFRYSDEEVKPPKRQRILANMPVKASWVNNSGETVQVDGMTENLGETSALVNLSELPPVGSEVTLTIFDLEREVVEVETQVIRLERDPSKPLAALSILKNMKAWKDDALEAGRAWVTRNWKLNYEEEWAN